VTPKQIVNIKDAVDSDAANLDGYDELPEDLQEKIAQALEEGHVADEDWGGVSSEHSSFIAVSDSAKDVEMNRPGKNGFRTPETKKARKEVARVSFDPYRVFPFRFLLLKYVGPRRGSWHSESFSYQEA